MKLGIWKKESFSKKSLNYAESEKKREGGEGEGVKSTHDAVKF